MKEKLQQLLSYLELGIPEDDVEKELLNFIYFKNKENTLNLFLRIQELDRQRIKEENNFYFQGLQDSLGSLGVIGEELLNKKDPKKAKAFAEFIFNENPSYLINCCKVYFPNAKSNGGSGATKFVMDKLVEMIRKNKSKYIKGGDSYDWTVMFKHDKYIELIIKEYNL